MSTYLVPTISLRGLYELRAPWQNDLQVNTAYTCTAVRRLSDIVSEGKDPYTLFYVPKNISKDLYDQDVDNGVLIVTLQTSDGATVRVPNSYIAKIPGAGAVPYNVLILSVNLGAIADSKDLSPYLTKVEELTLATLGIEATANLAVVSNTQMLTKQEADAVEAARDDKISQTYTDYSEVLALKEQLRIAKEQYDNLVTWTQNNCPIP